MGRVRRILGEGLCYHIVTRCNNKERLLVDPEDCHRFLSVLEHYREKLLFELHAFVVMHSHVHLMLTTRGEHQLDRVMHDICDTYALDFNQRHRRTGHLWVSPYRSRVVEGELYALACLRYIHHNPKRAGLVADPAAWPWSSHRFYARGELVGSATILPHPVYQIMGRSVIQQQMAYLYLLEMGSVDEENEKVFFEGKMKPKSQRGQRYLRNFDSFLRPKTLPKTR